MKKKLFLCLLIIVSILIIKSVYAETYNGEYSIEYLLRNYNVVTLGEKEYNIPTNYMYYMLERGNISNLTNIDGAVLINGDYILSDEEKNGNFGSKAGNIKSYIKGTMSSNITAASQLITDPNYIDFKKLYEAIVVESHILADKTEYYINSPKLEITKPLILYTDNIFSKEFFNMFL